ncbi:hypothetical protein Q760_01025 [Cellulomonas cellasea DSM 20118]|uniref:Uncharacterized protein n=1 Tax=Cellulomonas cellasea DSM 20118 TaxID=1408250 RepID=A0A0A0B8C7_9CELL|nr:hypothetical protein Q760_01025 [Cellulomonas cellasea DSM 20118]
MTLVCTAHTVPGGRLPSRWRSAAASVDARVGPPEVSS